MTTRFHHARFAARGAALIAVFWLIAVLGMILFSGARMLEADTKVARVNRGRIFAQRYAESGLEVARHPAITSGDPLLQFNGADGGGYRVNIVSEEGRININTILLSADRSALNRLFISWGMAAAETSALVDALKDWVDADELVSLNGAEKNEYEKEGLEGMPYNRPFKDLDEIALVRGAERLDIIKPGWRNFFTVYGDGRLDANEASPEALAALTNLPLAQMKALEDFRAGPDHVRGTPDDRRIVSVAQFAQALGMNVAKVSESFGRMLRFDGALRRIESTGRMGGISRKFVLVAQGNKVLWRGEVPSS